MIGQRGKVATRRFPRVVLGPICAISMMTGLPAANASVLGEENLALAKLVGLQMEELAEIGNMLTQLRLMIQGVNEVSAGVRQAYRIYETVRHYSVDDLIRDAKKGLHQAFPELRTLDEELRILVKNGEAIESGHFMTRTDRHDAKMRRLIDATARHAYRSTLWPIVFPDAAELGDEPTKTEKLVHERLQRSGMNMRTIVENTALGVLAKKAAHLAKEAESKKRVDLQSQAIGAQANVQNANNTTAMKRIKEMEIAREEARVKSITRFERKARKNLADSAYMLFRPGNLQ